MTEETQTNIDDMVRKLQETVDSAVEAVDDRDFSAAREKLAEVNNNIGTVLMQANVEEVSGDD